MRLSARRLRSTTALPRTHHLFVNAHREVVEMATIVLGVGEVRGWSSTLFGGGVGLVVLAVIVAVLGPLLTRVPINLLRIIVGMLLLLFGLQWLGKSTFRIGRQGFRSGGEDEEEEVESSSDKPLSGGVDWTAFALSFKGVFLEGLEVVFIVVTFGAAANRVGLAAAAAGAAFVVIAAATIPARKALQQLPANSIKYIVGILLTSYGTFRTQEGPGIHRPGGPLAILYLIALNAGFSLLAIRVVRKSLGMVAETAEDEQEDAEEAQA